MGFGLGLGLEGGVVEHPLEGHEHAVHDDDGDAAVPHLPYKGRLIGVSPRAYGYRLGAQGCSRTESSTREDQPSPPGGTMQKSEVERSRE